MKDKQENSNVLWTPVCMSIGIGVGMAIGSSVGQMPAGLSIGIGFGLAVGGILDRISKKNTTAIPEEE